MPALVIVGPGGIGRAIAREHAARGRRIALIGRSSEKLAAAAAECGATTTLVADPTAVDALPAATLLDGDDWREARGKRREARGERREARGERREARGERREARGERRIPVAR
jgi:threonine dehydrogenase-like Zn-dependent dehydrogenase